MAQILVLLADDNVSVGDVVGAAPRADPDARALQFSPGTSGGGARPAEATAGAGRVIQIYDGVILDGGAAPCGQAPTRPAGRIP